MADISTVAQTFDNAGAQIATANAAANNYKLLGDGTAGVGPYTRFGTPQLLALKIVSTALDETTTPAITKSILQQIINGLQAHAEVYYVGIPAANFIVAIVNASTVSRGGNGAAAYGGTDDAGETTFENLETLISLAAGQAVTDITVTAVTLTGGTFA